MHSSPRRKPPPLNHRSSLSPSLSLSLCICCICWAETSGQIGREREWQGRVGVRMDVTRSGEEARDVKWTAAVAFGWKFTPSSISLHLYLLHPPFLFMAFSLSGSLKAEASVNGATFCPTLHTPLPPSLSLSLTLSQTHFLSFIYFSALLLCVPPPPESRKACSALVFSASCGMSCSSYKRKLRVHAEVLTVAAAAERNIKLYTHTHTHTHTRERHLGSIWSLRGPRTTRSVNFPPVCCVLCSSSMSL